MTTPLTPAGPTAASHEVVSLHAGHTGVVLDLRSGIPALVHWGTPLHPDEIAALAALQDRPTTHGTLDVEAPASLVPEHGSGWVGRPGLSGHRPDGSAWAPRFTLTSAEVTHGDPSPTILRTVSHDHLAGLELHTTVSLGPVLRVDLGLVNTGASPYHLLGLLATLPLPAHANELMGFAGRWCWELHPVREPWTVGCKVSEHRRGRTSHEHPPLCFAGSDGFGEWHGEVWGVHLAWSGNSTVAAEHLADGRRYLQAGELFHPGEVTLAPGERIDVAPVLGTYGPTGLNSASDGFHRALRERPHHVHARGPRPVVLNTWEAVYFDHDIARLEALATVAAEVGVERFVLDDGWFGGRRDDHAGLGDWVVSPELYPDGLAPLIAHVRSLGMDFGIWVEPEMVNPDSDLYRAHPEWAMTAPGYPPVFGRHQLVLNLAHPDAFAHVFGHLDALLAHHDIAYVKWDMNRDHVHGTDAQGRAVTRAQTLAVYRLLDELRRRHPAVEIESCASGGGRIDHGILERTDRVWTSDCNDALERQAIQRGASLLIPPEIMGAHLGGPLSHTTSRQHHLAFRATTALFGHFGVEWNLLDLDARQRAQVAEVIAVHKRFRPLLHHGDAVRFDHPDPSGQAHGVYAADRSEALVCFAQLSTAAALIPAPLRLPGLDADATYKAALVTLPGHRYDSGLHLPAWASTGEHRVTGRTLAVAGLQLPVLAPESAVMVHLIRD